jgi:hypothetical protein
MKRPPGRPPLDQSDTSVKVSISLPLQQFDSICERARTDGISVPERIRRDLAQRVKHEKIGD